MVQSQYCLCWDSYKSSICSGFSSLQQNGEFVDITLAADGHYVKVHQALLAMASPYLKDLIKSVPSQHPVIFLNNVSYTNLCLLLEYIYTGEVLVHADNFSSFAETAKALHIKGIENITGNDNVKNVSGIQVENNKYNNMRTNNSMPVIPTEITRQVTLPTSVKKIYIKQEDSQPITIKSTPNLTTSSCKTDIRDYTDAMEDSGTNDNDEYIQERYPSMDTAVMDESGISKNALPMPATSLQFTVSIRGSLQMILNRYMYNLNSTTNRTGVKRWRCVDYRNNKCSAFVVTKDNIVVNRGNLHNHPYHDKKILTKIEKKAVFSKLDDIKTYREIERRNSDSIETSMDDEHFISLDDFSSEINDKNDTIKNT